MWFKLMTELLHLALFLSTDLRITSKYHKYALVELFFL